MIMLLDTSTPLCRLYLVDNDQTVTAEWQADRELAKHLLAYVRDQLSAHGRQWTDITGIGVFRGPGSFTGLRIGLTVMNTLADAEQIPIVGEDGDDWQRQSLERLRAGENDHVVLPLYGSDPHITTQRK